MNNNYKGIINTDSRLFLTVMKSLVVGILVSAVVVAYRLLLGVAEDASISMYKAVQGHFLLTSLTFAGLILSAFFIGYLLRRWPLISGSGIPQVKGIMLGYFENRWLSTLIAKFFGGALCILAGLSLGREGPSIQLGACVADGFSSRFAATRMEKKILMASGASAGLAAAFNAPLAGVIFTLEEVFKYFSPTILLSAMTAAVASDFVSKNVFGLSPIFSFPITETLPLASYWILLPMGIVLGLAGVVYNRTLLGTQAAYKRLPETPGWLYPVIPFVLAGMLGLTIPTVLGGGHHMLEYFSMNAGFGMLLGLLFVKFAFSMISFGSGAPGGIFFPLLIMGAAVGAVLGRAAILYAGLNEALYYNFIILAMAGFFASIVRAPITGIILIVEMTGSLSHLLSLTVVSLVAYLTADLMQCQPIYESLLAKQIRQHRGRRRHLEDAAGDKKITIETIVRLESEAAGKAVKDVPWPSQCLLIAVKREGKEFIPKGSTTLMPGDYLICIAPLSLETETRRSLQHLVHKEK